MIYDASILIIDTHIACWNISLMLHLYQAMHQCLLYEIYMTLGTYIHTYVCAYIYFLEVSFVEWGYII